MHPGSFPAFGDVWDGARFLGRLPPFLRRPVGLDEARAVLRRRLERREADFLGFVDAAVYRQPASPYRELLRWAGTGYAVANAHPALLAAGLPVTAANDDDGVARVLESLLL